MKKLTILFLLIPLLSAVKAQNVPQKFNYQGVARDGSGKALIQTDVTLQVAIVSSNDLDRPIYLEEHTVNTGKLGMFNLQIGGGDVLEGNMDQIDWGASSHFLSIRMDTEGSGNFQEMGISQLLSVPYALYAEKSGTAAFSEEGGSRNDPNDWTINGNTGTDENVNFIGTTDSQDLVVKTNSLEVARFTTEGNIELNANASIKAGTQNILNAIGTRNIHIGRDAGAVSTGSQNSFIGSSAGSSNTTGYDNAFIGPGAGRDNTTGYRNVFIGFSTGRTNTTGYRNTFIGGQSGFSNTEGFGNSGIGFRTGYANTTGIRNTFIGDYAGQSNTTGYFNTYVGKEADGAPDIFNATAIGAGAYAAESNTVILGNGVNVGIGTSAPQSELHVVGNIRMVDGNQQAGYIPVADTNGTMIWTDPTGISGDVDIVTDTDNDTKIQVEEGADEDIIRFDMAGTEFFRMDSGRLEVVNTGQNIYVGLNAGRNDNYAVSTYNLGVGASALMENTTGWGNIALGGNSLFSNTTGSENISIGQNAMQFNETSATNLAIGSSALISLISGTDNTALGHYAGDDQGTGTRNTLLGSHADVSSSGLTNATAVGATATVGCDSCLVLGDAANVGIGTSTPADKLHVVGNIRMVDGNQQAGYVMTSDANGTASWQATTSSSSPMVFDILGGVVVPGSAVDESTDDFVFGSPQLNDDGNTDHDKRFFFDKSKAAFRAGQVQGVNWNVDSIGIASVAMGNETRATGNYSTALGNQAKASGQSSTATGFQTLASGNNSTAMGTGTTASGASATAIGANTTASAISSTAMGRETEASGLYSTALGNSTLASGANSTAMGIGATANGTSATAMGAYTTASANASMATGSNTTASGDKSTAMGDNTTASGINSTALGASTTASGTASTAMGQNTSAPSGYETTIGRYNTPYTPISTTGWNAADRLFTIGKGTSSTNLLDAMVVLKNGNTGLGISTPSATLDLVGTFQYVDGTQTNGHILTSDASGNASWTSPANISGIKRISDADNDTKIQVEESTDEDMIRFDVAGTEHFRMEPAKLFVNSTNAFTQPAVNLYNSAYSYTSSIQSSVAIGPVDSDDYFLDLIVRGNNTLRLSGAGRITVNNSYTLPTSDGTSQQVLTTNGSGTTSWQSPVWASSGNDIYSANSGNVGIGVTSPRAALHVNEGSTGFGWTPFSQTTAILERTGGSLLTLVSSNTGVSSLVMGDTDEQFRGRVRYEHTGDRMEFWTANTERVSIQGDGNVGIGTTSAGAKLDVNGNARIGGMAWTTGNFGAGAGAQPNLTLSIGAPSTGIQNDGSNNLQFIHSAVERVRFQDNGNVGIGTTDPQAKLDVNGQTNTGSLKVGSSGTVMAEILIVSVAYDLTGMGPNENKFVEFAVPGAEVGDLVFVSIDGKIDESVVIGACWVKDTDIVEVKFRNTEGISFGNGEVPERNYKFMVVKL